jgi:S1-C subfamily serine protease
VSTLLRESGPYAIEISMRGCSAARCRYAWQLLRLESRDGGSDGATGSCFAVGPGGLVLTARHVLEGAHQIDVSFPGGMALPATVEREDEATDVALLRVRTPTPEYLNLVRAGSVRLGEPVFTIGFPAVDVLGEEPKFADGTIGALAGLEHDPPSLQLSIPVQPGSSGAPVVNDRGEVVGIVESVADADFFGGDSGLVPQSLSWAVKAEAIHALVPPAPPRPATSSRADAVARVLRAVCLVETR